MKKLFKSATFSFPDHHSIKSLSPFSPPPPSHHYSFKSSHSSLPSHHHHHSRTPSSSSSQYTFSESTNQEILHTATQIITKWGCSGDSGIYEAAESLFTEDRKEEVRAFISIVLDLQAAMKYLLSTDPYSDMLIQGQNLLQTAMTRLQREFYIILKTNKQYLHPESLSTRLSKWSSNPSPGSSHGGLWSRSSKSDFEDPDDLVSEEDYSLQSGDGSGLESNKLVISAMNDLKLIADCMISSGYAKECVMVFKMVRKSIVAEALYSLGFERLCSSTSSKLHKMSWESLEPKIKNWLSAVYFAVRALFNGEKILSDHVFSSSSTIGESCFSEIIRDGALSLFAFPEQIVAKRKKLTENSSETGRIFDILDLYEAIVELSPEIEYIFSCNSTSVVRSQAETSLLKLGEAARAMIGEFESSIQKETAKSQPVPGGDLHPLTTNVMNYVMGLSEYSVVLTEILGDCSLALPEDYFESPYGSDVHANVASRFAWIILILLCKLDGKAGRHGDVALSYLFLANNLWYIVDKVRRTVNLRRLLGERWLERQEAKVRQYTASYERVGWGKVISSFQPEVEAAAEVGAGGVGGEAVENSVEESREWFLKFNAAFEEAHRKQKDWAVVDRKMRDEITVAVARKVVPGYRKEYGKYRGALVRGKGVNGGVKSVVRFAPEDLENYLSVLHFGTGGVGGDSGGSASSRSETSLSSSSASSTDSSPSNSVVGSTTTITA
ncbi:hypothetical protein Ancab_011769 [Ancistrocladus abbreviatus]